jgi:tetratricopeptide (TPR) repeat protein
VGVFASAPSLRVQRCLSILELQTWIRTWAKDYSAVRQSGPVTSSALKPNIPLALIEAKDDERFRAVMANGLGHPMMPGGGAGRSSEALQRAVFALNNGRPKEAEQIAGDALKADPNDGQALRIFGYALLMQDRAEDAIALLEPAAQARRDPEIDTQLAIALRELGRNEDALSRLKRATKRRPPFAAAFHQLGSLLFSMERHDEAIEVLSRGLEIAAMMPELSIQIGHVFLECRKYPDAKAAFARALSLSPDSADALYGLAKAHLRLGEYRPAEGYFRRCLMRTPDDANLWLDLGHCLLENGERDAGYGCFRMAARGDSKSYARALSSLVKSGHGRFWLKPSAATGFLGGPEA